MAFREKKDKKYTVDGRTTLDAKHTAHIENIKHDRAAWTNYYLLVGDILKTYYTEGVRLGENRTTPVEEWTARLNGVACGGARVEPCAGCSAVDKWQEIGDEAVEVCTACGTQRSSWAVSDAPAYKESNWREKHNLNYRRINHFTEVMNQIQAKETTVIPQEVMDAIIVELKKQRVANMATVTREQIRLILRKIGQDKYYDHSAWIWTRLTGVPLPPLSPAICEQLNARFNEAQSQWFLHRPEARRNFIGYNYVVYKLFELLELDDYKHFCNLMKTREKLVEYDKIWKAICNDIQWEFIPTV